MIVFARPDLRMMESILLSKNWNNAVSCVILLFLAYLPAISLTSLTNCLSESIYILLRTCLFLKSFPYSEDLCMLAPCCPGKLLFFFTLYLFDQKRSTCSLLHNLNLGPVYLITH